MTILLNLLTCVSSLSVLLYFMYLRITKNIPIIVLEPNQVNYYYPLFLYLFIISIGFLSFLFILWLLKVKFLKEQKNNKFFLWFVLWYPKVNIFYKTYVLLFDWLGPNYTEYLVVLARKFIGWKNTIRVGLILVFCVLPRVIILIVLVYEIYVGLLHYYFYTLLLLFIPLFFKFILFMLKDVGPRLLPEFREFLIFDTSLKHIHVNLDDSIKKLKPIAIRFKSEYDDINLEFFLRTYYYPMLYIESELALNFLPKYSKISTLTLIIYYVIQGLGWFYVLNFLS